MPRATKILTTLAAAAAALCLSASATAAMPKGTLSGAEYKQLSAVTAALNVSASSKSINWTKAHAACARTGSATALLRTEGASCLDSLSVLEALTNFPAEQRRCAAAPKTTTTRRTTTGTTTTGTATTGAATTGAATTGAAAAASAQAAPAVIRLMVCMSPHYQALGRDAKAVYTADTSARKQALLRGFSGSCLATLASTPADLGKERQFALASGKLAADVTLLIRVTDGKAPASEFSQARIDTDVRRFETSATAVLAERNEQKLSSCPHE